MTIHILNCGTIRPYFPRVESGVTCLLVETDLGPVLVDTGMGVGDYTRPGRLMRFFTAAMRTPRRLDETALHQVRQLGYRAEDVTTIVMTHLHLDHAGGLPDFPQARVMLYEPEYQHATGRRAGWEYIRDHWAHGPRWETQRLAGDKWYDFGAIPLRGFTPELWLVPLVGHSPGHSGVAVRDGDGWLFHAGDAVPFNLAVDEVPDSISRLFIGPHVPHLREFMKAQPDVRVVGSHMALDFYPPAGSQSP